VQISVFDSSGLITAASVNTIVGIVSASFLLIALCIMSTIPPDVETFVIAHEVGWAWARS
jgi:hypothetical protein